MEHPIDIYRVNILALYFSSYLSTTKNVTFQLNQNLSIFQNQDKFNFFLINFPKQASQKIRTRCQDSIRTKTNDTSLTSYTHPKFHY